MPRNAKLKVYRTAIGFHDAYVAAASQKAALKAWGSDKDLFARGAAEHVDEPALTAAPLASPGKVIRVLRGTEEEQIAALPPDRPKAPAPSPPRRRSTPKVKPKPRPSRSELDTAEAELAEMEKVHADAMKALTVREAALAEERRALERTQADQRKRTDAARDRAAAQYERKMHAWKAGE